jgi:hypothetical protein
MLTPPNEKTGPRRMAGMKGVSIFMVEIIHELRAKVLPWIYKKRLLPVNEE